MDFAFSPDQERFRREIRDVLATTVIEMDDPSKSRGLKGGYSTSFYRALAARGWIGLQIPSRYGGAGRPPVDELILAEELGLAGAPTGNYAGTVLEFGHLLLRHGTEWQRRTYLPRIVSGELRAGHAYTEPEAGSDLAAVRTTAIRDGDDWIVTGLKTFASEVHRTDVSVLMARTDPDATPEQAVTLFILDNHAPGVSHTRLPTFGGKGTNQLYLDRVRIPDHDRIGDLNGGWRAFLDIRFEYWAKNQGYYCGTLARLLDQLVAMVRGIEQPTGSPDPLLRDRLATLAIDLRQLRWLSYRLATTPRPHEEARQIAVLKVMTDELLLRFGDEALAISSRVDPAVASPVAGMTLENRYRENALKHFSSQGHAYARTVLATEVLGLPGETG